jgi:hypothetical protein
MMIDESVRPSARQSDSSRVSPIIISIVCINLTCHRSGKDPNHGLDQGVARGSDDEHVRGVDLVQESLGVRAGSTRIGHTIENEISTS